MGTWGILPFANDDAADWAYEVEGDSDLTLVRSKLSEVLAVDGDLPAPLACEGVAAAELVSICLGQGQSAITPRLSKWVTATTDRPTDGDIELAQGAVDRILSVDSELRELWEEQRDTTWMEYMTEMKSRLARTEDRDTYLVVEGMEQNVGQAHRVDRFMYFGDEASAHRALSELRNDGLSLSIDRGDAEEEWCVTASRTMHITYILVMRITNRMRQMAEAFGGDLDGWGIDLGPS